jgi:hypothetical protein
MEKIICPVCGAATSLNPVLIKDNHAFMPDRSSDTESVYEKAVVRAIKEAEYPYKVSYGIYQCQACGERFVAKFEEYVDKDWVAVYPIPHKPVSEEMPQPIKSEFEEANLCFAVGAYRACASMCQRVLESLCQNKTVSGLNQLKDDGIISSTLFDRTTEIRLWAGITKHKPLTESVSKEDAEQLLLYLEMILNAVYVEPKRFDALRQKRKQLEKKSD